MTQKIKEIFEGLMLGFAIGGLFVVGAIYGMKQTQPDLNTVTIHKQDRLTLPCPQGGE